MTRRRAEQRAAVEERRTRVMTLLVARRTPTEIAHGLGVDASTVRRDMEAVRQEWAKARVELRDRYADEQLAALDEMEKLLWPEVRGGRNGKPDLWAVDRLLAVLRDKRALLGLDAPTKMEVGGEGVAGLLRLLDDLDAIDAKEAAGQAVTVRALGPGEEDERRVGRTSG